jgi:hypothetical protein
LLSVIGPLVCTWGLKDSNDFGRLHSNNCTSGHDALLLVSGCGFNLPLGHDAICSLANPVLMGSIGPVGHRQGTGYFGAYALGRTLYCILL